MKGAMDDGWTEMKNGSLSEPSRLHPLSATCEHFSRCSLLTEIPTHRKQARTESICGVASLRKTNKCGRVLQRWRIRSLESVHAGTEIILHANVPYAAHFLISFHLPSSPSLSSSAFAFRFMLLLQHVPLFCAHVHFKRCVCRTVPRASTSTSYTPYERSIPSNHIGFSHVDNHSQLLFLDAFCLYRQHGS